LLDTASKFALFSVSSLKDKKLIKSKPTQQLKHANSILESFEHFCQILSKSIVIILSYTVSKLACFFETQCSILIKGFHMHVYSLFYKMLEMLLVAHQVHRSRDINLFVQKHHTLWHIFSFATYIFPHISRTFIKYRWGCSPMFPLDMYM